MLENELREKSNHESNEKSGEIYLSTSSESQSRELTMKSLD